MLHEIILENREKYCLKLLTCPSIRMKLLKPCFLSLLIPESGVSKHAGVTYVTTTQRYILPLLYITEFCHVAMLSPSNKQYSLPLPKSPDALASGVQIKFLHLPFSNVNAMFPLWCFMAGQGKHVPMALFVLIMLEKCVNFPTHGCDVSQLSLLSIYAIFKEAIDLKWQFLKIIVMYNAMRVPSPQEVGAGFGTDLSKVRTVFNFSVS